MMKGLGIHVHVCPHNGGVGVLLVGWPALLGTKTVVILISYKDCSDSYLLPSN